MTISINGRDTSAQIAARLESFNPFFKVLCIFPSWYLCAGLWTRRLAEAMTKTTTMNGADNDSDFTIPFSQGSGGSLSPSSREGQNHVDDDNDDDGDR